VDWHSYFHHPDLSLPVIRRRVVDELIDLTVAFAEVSTTRGRALSWRSLYETDTAYRNAMYRLRKQGLLAYREGRGNKGKPVLALTDTAKQRGSPLLKPNRYWRKRWHRIWYVLMYDVPEEERPYRDALRGFLKRMRMGCLQRSVWVSPRDIRPEYDDLRKAVDVDKVSFLMEATTVLGRSPQDIVESAWDFERLEHIQVWYCKAYEHNLELIRATKPSKEMCRTWAREELSAYLSAMQEDPLLPEELLPRVYHGRQVYALHRAFTKTLGRRL